MRFKDKILLLPQIQFRDKIWIVLLSVVAAVWAVHVVWMPGEWREWLQLFGLAFGVLASVTGLLFLFERWRLARAFRRARVRPENLIRRSARVHRLWFWFWQSALLALATAVMMAGVFVLGSMALNTLILVPGVVVCLYSLFLGLRGAPPVRAAVAAIQGLPDWPVLDALAWRRRADAAHLADLDIALDRIQPSWSQKFHAILRGDPAPLPDLTARAAEHPVREVRARLRSVGAICSTAFPWAVVALIVAAVWTPERVWSPPRAGVFLAALLPESEQTEPDKVLDTDTASEDQDPASSEDQATTTTDQPDAQTGSRAETEQANGQQSAENQAAPQGNAGSDNVADGQSDPAQGGWSAENDSRSGANSTGNLAQNDPAGQSKPSANGQTQAADNLQGAEDGNGTSGAPTQNSANSDTGNSENQAGQPQTDGTGLPVTQALGDTPLAAAGQSDQTRPAAENSGQTPSPAQSGAAQAANTQQGAPQSDPDGPQQGSSPQQDAGQAAQAQSPSASSPGDENADAGDGLSLGKQANAAGAQQAEPKADRGQPGEGNQDAGAQASPNTAENSGSDAAGPQGAGAGESAASQGVGAGDNAQAGAAQSQGAGDNSGLSYPAQAQGNAQSAGAGKAPGNGSASGQSPGAGEQGQPQAATPSNADASNPANGSAQGPSQSASASDQASSGQGGSAQGSGNVDANGQNGEGQLAGEGTLAIESPSDDEGTNAGYGERATIIVDPADIPPDQIGDPLQNAGQGLDPTLSRALFAPPGESQPAFVAEIPVKSDGTKPPPAVHMPVQPMPHWIRQLTEVRQGG